MLRTIRRSQWARLAVLGVLCVVLFAGCASSSNLVNLWKDPAFQNQPLTNVLVVAFRQDPVVRRVWEDGFAAELTRHGVNTTQSYRLWPDAVPDTQQVVDAVGEKGFDAVIVSRRLPTDTLTNYVPGYTSTQPVTYQSPWTGMYRTYYRQVTTPGYTETSRVVRHQTDVWSTKGDGLLVWSGTSETVDPTSRTKALEQISKLIGPELAKQGIIPPEK